MKRRLCSIIVLTILLSLSPISTSFAVSAPVIRADEAVYQEGEITTLYWTDVSDALNYDIFISKEPYGEHNLVIEDSLSECEYNLGGLSAGRYRANVRGVTAAGQTEFSNRVYFKVTDGGSVESILNNETAEVFLWPVKDDPEYSGSSYAITATDIYFDGGNHGKLKNALDINNDGMQERYETREIVATAAGTVLDVHRCGHSGIYCPTRSCEGTYIEIQHEIADPVTGELTQYISFYCHIDPKTVLVDEGEEVEQGQSIARMGSTGNSSGIHLHFAIRDEHNSDIPTLEFFMNDSYMPLLQFKYFRRSSSGKFIATNEKISRYSDWIEDNYRYSSSRLWVFYED